MTEPDSDDERNKRIRTKIIVDACTPDEQAISWCYYLTLTKTIIETNSLVASWPGQISR